MLCFLVGEFPKFGDSRPDPEGQRFDPTMEGETKGVNWQSSRLTPMYGLQLEKCFECFVASRHLTTIVVVKQPKGIHVAVL